MANFMMSNSILSKISLILIVAVYFTCVYNLKDISLKEAFSQNNQIKNECDYKCKGITLNTITQCLDACAANAKDNKLIESK
jgi:hypothetical protein